MFPQQKRRKTLLDFNLKKIRNNDCEYVKKNISVDDLACSKNNPINKHAQTIYNTAQAL